LHRPAQAPIRCFLTARDTGDCLTERPALAPQADAPGLPTVIVDTGRTFQRIEGFGGAFTEASAVNWLALDEVQRQQVLEAYFDPVRGHGYSLCRVHMGSCDFALGNYAHAETHDDMSLESFSIERDRRALLPFIRAAQRVAGAPLKLLASPWSPPAWMK
jgi:glucosylceramidase